MLVRVCVFVCVRERKRKSTMIGGAARRRQTENPEKNPRGPLDFRISRAHSREVLACPLFIEATCMCFDGKLHAAAKNAEVALAPE